ncbi:HEPN domain-containing protein [bacterium]|nr:HEPN domain-containing protein [bacterium]
MSDFELANLMLKIANKDLKALKGMLDEKVFEDNIFGFHVQQTIEKALKAWLATLDIKYPHSHDINLLLNLLAKNGCNVSDYEHLVEYNIFAVQYRYEAYDDLDEPIDRKSIITYLEELLKHISNISKHND